MSRTAVIAGVGPGLGESLARRFAAEGCQVALLARSDEYIADLSADLDGTAGAGLAVPTDLTDSQQIAKAFDRVHEAFGPVDVLVNHASAAPWKGLTDVTGEEFENAMAVGPRAALCCSRAAADDMLGNGDGTIIFTGATSAVRGREGALAFSAAKFACRGMAQSMARELGPEGIHVAHVVLDGGIRPPDRDVDDPEAYLDPDDIAETYWHLIEQEETHTMDFEVHVTNGNQSIEFL